MSGVETIMSEVVAALLGGTISASILYPLKVLKTTMQAEDQGNDDDDDDDDNTNCMIFFAKNLYHKEGSSVFFRGMETSAFHSALEKALYFFACTAKPAADNTTINNSYTGGNLAN
jgi:hypothetical protein